MKRVIIFLAITVFAMMVWSIVTHPPAPLENTDVSGQVIPVPTSVPAANPNLSRALDSTDKMTAAVSDGFTKAINTAKVIAIIVVAAVVLIVGLVVFQAGRTKIGFASITDLNNQTTHKFIGVAGDGSDNVPSGAFQAAEAVGKRITDREVGRYLPKPGDILDV